jgi:hypothetical protein
MYKQKRTVAVATFLKVIQTIIIEKVLPRVP